MKNQLVTPILFLLFISSTSVGETHIVDQKNKEFSVDKLVIKTGDVVEFTNQDNFNHNVFSLSDTKTFDLGSYPKGQSKSVVFDRAGTVDVECAIHSTMRMRIEVKD